MLKSDQLAGTRQQPTKLTFAQKSNAGGLEAFSRKKFPNSIIMILDKAKAKILFIKK